jgi:hypothetical protein
VARPRESRPDRGRSDDAIDAAKYGHRDLHASLRLPTRHPPKAPNRALRIRNEDVNSWIGEI